MLISWDLAIEEGTVRDYSTKISKGNSGRTLSKEPKKESCKRGTKAGKAFGIRGRKGDGK